jgi:hypothetical protein
METQSMTNGVKNMKVFKFDPKTGKRGEQIDTIARPSTFGQSVEFAQSQGVQTHLSFVKPSNTDSQVWSSHIYMGREDATGELVVSEYDTWVCCCSGECNGQPTSTGTAWVWHIIPPYASLTKNTEAA